MRIPCSLFNFFDRGGFKFIQNLAKKFNRKNSDPWLILKVEFILIYKELIFPKYLLLLQNQSCKVNPKTFQELFEIGKINRKKLKSFWTIKNKLKKKSKKFFPRKLRKMVPIFFSKKNSRKNQNTKNLNFSFWLKFDKNLWFLKNEQDVLHSDFSDLKFVSPKIFFKFAWKFFLSFYSQIRNERQSE